MFKKKPYILLVLVLLILFAGACGEYEKLLKSRDFQKKYEVGLQYFE